MNNIPGLLIGANDFMQNYSYNGSRNHPDETFIAINKEDYYVWDLVAAGSGLSSGWIGNSQLLDESSRGSLAFGHETPHKCVALYKKRDSGRSSIFLNKGKISPRNFIEVTKNLTVLRREDYQTNGDYKILDVDVFKDYKTCEKNAQKLLLLNIDML